MPWKIASEMSEKKLFVALASAKDSNMSDLCERFGISRPTGYKWVRRGSCDGDAGLIALSRRPHHSPRRTHARVEEAVVVLRRKHPAWGSRKIGQVLRNKNIVGVPADSTINEILRRHGLIEKHESEKHHAWIRFEHAAPNDLWQMDFKGHFALTDAIQRCHPLTILDDHSRFSLGIRACAYETHAVVREALMNIFRQYGMPLCILSDNGPPWGTAGGKSSYTALSAWLMQLGIHVSHGRPLHPQTQGKDERFHRTLKVEVLREHHFETYNQCQYAFDDWREIYNCERPHQALGMVTPVTRYKVSPRTFPEQLPVIEYGPDDLVRKVKDTGKIHYKGHQYWVGKAFRFQPIALRPTETDGVYDVYFCHQRVNTIDFRTNQSQENV